MFHEINTELLIGKTFVGKLKSLKVESVQYAVVTALLIVGPERGKARVLVRYGLLLTLGK